jgi:TatD DNase family protein
MLVDTHTHIYLDQFDDDRAEMMQRAKDNGVEKFYLPNIDSSSIDAMLNLEKLDKRVFCAIGEIGIDLHWDTSTFEIQKEAFRTQIKWAKELDVPVVIHSRKSTKEVIDVLREEKDDRLRGIFHCFGGSVEEAKSIIDLGFYLGIGGVVTFKKAGLDKTMEDIPLENVVLETDSPYLSPSPYRGKRNESGYVKLVAEKLAAIKNRTLEEVAEITSKNALDIFEK